jgi:hypothetical protein
MDRDTTTVVGEFIFRDLGPVSVVVWDADMISAHDVLARYTRCRWSPA